MCDSGRNERKRSDAQAGIARMEAMTLLRILPCDSITPLGRPVVPEV